MTGIGCRVAAGSMPAARGGASGLGDRAGGAGVALALLPCRDLPVDVTTEVVCTGRAHVLARLLVRGPRLAIDADHAAGGSLRRHVDSVADRTRDGHLAFAFNHSVPVRCRGTWVEMGQAGRATAAPTKPP